MAARRRWRLLAGRGPSDRATDLLQDAHRPSALRQAVFRRVRATERQRAVDPGSARPVLDGRHSSIPRRL